MYLNLQWEHPEVIFTKILTENKWIFINFLSLITVLTENSYRCAPSSPTERRGLFLDLNVEINEGLLLEVASNFLHKKHL